jgi:GT2 family glycosyltransferase
MTWSVIIPSARPENLIQCAKSVFRTHPGLEPHRVVVVDDGARAGAERELPPGITWVEGVKPFIYARNVNLGVAASSPNDIVILGDDSEILTERCFDRLAAFLSDHPNLAVLSTGVRGMVGNPRQSVFDPDLQANLNIPINERIRKKPGRPLPPQPISFRMEKESLAFVCVMIPRTIWIRLGTLDERFSGYGCEDSDYCRRARECGLDLGIYYECGVEHGVVPSTFRTRLDWESQFRENIARLEEKWREQARQEPRPE